MTSLHYWLKHCTVCPNACNVDRTSGEKGRCRIGEDIVISDADLHFGEESCLVGSGGSGTIFLTACNLGCVFCQNYDISQMDRGKRISSEQLLRIIHELSRRGANNINFVSPTHQAPQVFDVVKQARSEGLSIPIVYNCGGYENPEFIRALSGLVDIYMPDFKYGNNRDALAYSGVEGYVENCTASILEMHRQVGDLVLDSNGAAKKGLLVRHLVLPNKIAGSKAVIDILVSDISPNTYLNVMDQYRPAHRAAEFHSLSRRVLRSEVEDVVEYAKYRGMTRVLH
jgi:putative pyruvate formate lyase activating enzyme